MTDHLDRPAGPPTPALIERTMARDALAAGLGAARDGTGSVVVIEGPAGIGKTTVLDATAHEARAPLVVLRARGRELEQPIPFGVIRQLVERHLRGLSPDDRAAAIEGAGAIGADVVLTSTPAAEAQAMRLPDALHGLYWLLAGLAARRPLALIVDDAHWADVPSLQALAYLAHRVADTPIAVVLAGRPPVAGTASWTHDLRAVPAARWLTLEPLSEAGVRELLGDLTGAADPDGDVVAACQAMTGGVPLYVAELVRGLEHTGRTLSAADVRLIAHSPPELLARVVALQLTSAGTGAAEVAQAISVLGSGATVARIAALTGLTPAEVAERAGRLASAGILTDALPLRFGHPLLEACVTAGWPVAHRAAAHSRAAQILDAAGAPTAQIVTHLMQSDARGNADAARHLLDAGRGALRRGVPDMAAAYLQRALDEPPAPADRGPAELALGTALAAQGQVAEAEPHLRRALAQSADEDDRLDAALRLAAGLTVTDGQRAAIAALDAAATALTGERRLRADVERTSLAVNDAELTSGALARMRGYRTLAGDTPAERIALATAALATVFDPTQRREDAVPLALRALADGRLLADNTCEAPPWAYASYVVLCAEDFATMDRERARAFGDARSRGSVEAFAIASLGGLMRRSGNVLMHACAHAEALLTVRDSLPANAIWSFWGATCVRFYAGVLIERGETGRAAALVGSWLDGRDADLGVLHYANGLLLEATDRPAEALAAFAECGRLGELAGYEDRVTPWRLGVVRCALAIGDHATAAAHAQDAVRIASLWGAPIGWAASLRHRALTADPPAARTDLERAAALVADGDAHLEQAACLIALGGTLRRQGERRAARDRIEAGARAAERCGSRRWITAAEAELRVLGARPARRSFTGLEALTASEARVARMAAEGRSNREIAQRLFVTVKTVETHLGRVYRKLSIGGRSELEAALGGEPPEDAAASEIRAHP